MTQLPRMDSSVMNQQNMLSALSGPSFLDFANNAIGNSDVQVERLDTNRSSLFFVGPEGTGDVYKFKRELKEEGLDYGDMYTRERACQREVALNSPFAPSIYRGVVPASMTHDRRVVVSELPRGPILDYAVHMRRLPKADNFQFSMETQPEHAIGKLPEILDAVLSMHKRSSVVQNEENDQLLMNALETFRMTGRRLDATLKKVNFKFPLNTESMLVTGAESLIAEIGVRQKDGFYRNCHGNLQSGNIWIHGGNVLFLDAIEFNDSLANLDTWHDLAFLSADLHLYDKSEFAQSLYEDYIKATGENADQRLYSLYVAERIYIKANSYLMASKRAPNSIEVEKCLALAAISLRLASHMMLDVL